MWLASGSLLLGVAIASVAASVRSNSLQQILPSTGSNIDLRDIFRGDVETFSDKPQEVEQPVSKRDLPFTTYNKSLAYSPPSYPSPWGSGAGGWEDAYAKARAIVSQMTLYRVRFTPMMRIQADQICIG